MKNKNKKSASTVLKNQIFLWKLCFKTCPAYMIYHLYDAFRYQGVIFLEHVLGIRYVLRCAEFQEPFTKALFYIGLILLLNIIQIIPDGFFIYTHSAFVINKAWDRGQVRSRLKRSRRENRPILTSLPRL